jgi:hypothetical protein
VIHNAERTMTLSLCGPLQFVKRERGSNYEEPHAPNREDRVNESGTICHRPGWRVGRSSCRPLKRTRPCPLGYPGLTPRAFLFRRFAAEAREDEDYVGMISIIQERTEGRVSLHDDLAHHFRV